MFRKNSKRNFRRRKSESSEEDNEEQQRERARPRHRRNRGLACSSKPAPTPGRGRGRSARAESTSPSSAPESGSEDLADAGTELKDHARDETEKCPSRHAGNRGRSLLSFGCDREEGGEEFKVKKTGNTILFTSHWKKEKQNNVEKDEDISKDEETLQDSRLSKVQKESSSEEETVETLTKNEEEISSAVDEPEISRVAQHKIRPGEIPDARYIHAARKKRQMARAQVDFIPLHSLGRDDTSVPELNNEDLISDDELDDHERRIDFTELLKTQRQRMAEEIGVNESDDESLKSEEENDDQKLWEQQQIKRVKVLPSPGIETANQPSTLIMSRMLDTVRSLPPVNLETVKKRLINRLESLQEVYRSHHREHEKFQASAESSRCTIEHLEDTSDSGDRYRFYQEMRTYVQNLINCFNEKICVINELESEMHQLLGQQARNLLQRRQGDVQDESTDVWQLSNKADASSGSDTDCVKAKQWRIEKRDARRAHREHLRKVAGKEADHHKGLSSDDEVALADMSDFHEKEDRILKESKKIFEDVHKDFYSVDRILAKFGLWRQKFPDSYYDAYIGLCLQKILNPLIRMQLIGWNPLKPDCLDLVEMPWILALEEFCHMEHEEFKRKENSDTRLLPTVIEKTVMSKIEGFVIHVWDPLSSSQTHSLVQICRKLKEEYAVFKDEQSKATQVLRKTIVMRITLSVEEDVFIPLYPKRKFHHIWRLQKKCTGLVLENRTSIHSRFQERQFWSAVKLLGNIFQWDDLLPEQILQDMGLEKLLNRYILLILQTSLPGPENIEKCKKIIACFPKHWFEKLKRRSSIPQLENLCRYLLQSIRTIYENDAMIPDTENNGREAIKEMVKMLVLIHALDHTETIINECKLEDLEWIFKGN
ncbi:intron Large complex component GCFC2-like isoform X2 [Heptranchias perlo]|uniref:intron Large complex component GCFC2-like isoform X2 n=1 Tax=Heptranchias perlo TaxID=212740 RepID=UPI0035593F93